MCCKLQKRKTNHKSRLSCGIENIMGAVLHFFWVQNVNTKHTNFNINPLLLLKTKRLIHTLNRLIANSMTWNNIASGSREQACQNGDMCAPQTTNQYLVSLLMAFPFFLTKCCIYSTLYSGCQNCVFFSQNFFSFFWSFLKMCDIFYRSQKVRMRVALRLFIHPFW